MKKDAWFGPGVGGENSGRTTGHDGKLLSKIPEVAPSGLSFEEFEVEGSQADEACSFAATLGPRFGRLLAISA